MKNHHPATIDAYIAQFPSDVQKKLKQLRAAIQAAAPEAEETIKYAMPTFTFHGNLVHFAAFQNHIGFYPVPTAMAAFKEALSSFKTGKGSVQFPLDQPLPLDLVKKVVHFRMKENLMK